MVTVDRERRYVAANAAARLLLRLSLNKLKGQRIEDLTPAYLLSTLHERWDVMMGRGIVSGGFEMVLPDRSRVAIIYCALANALPGEHLIVFAPADWPDDELSSFEAEASDRLDISLDPAARLSSREREVLTLIAAGATFAQIAKELTISPATVRTHAQNALRKLGARNRAHAIAIAMHLGLIDLPLASSSPN